MIFFFKDKIHFVIYPKKISLDVFIKNAKVEKDSYFGRLLSNLYIALIKNSYDLKSEYLDFYDCEYLNFNEFLYKKYPHLEDEQFKEILLFLDTGNYIIGKGYMEVFSDYNLKTLIDYDESFLHKFKKLLLSEKYEN